MWSHIKAQSLDILKPLGGHNKPESSYCEINGENHLSATARKSLVK